MSCDKCRQDCLNDTGVSLQSCMKERCPECANKNICTNQDTFNQGFRKALKSYNKKESLKGCAAGVISIIYILFLVWALMLASKVQSKNDKSVHFVVALIAPPVYVLSYYLTY